MAETLSRRTLLAGLAALAPGLRAEDESGGFQGKRLWRTTPLDVTDSIGYFIDQPNSGARPGDLELAQWALATWDDVLSGMLCFTPAPAVKALVRVYWGQTGNRIGQMHAIDVDGRRGAEVYVDPFADRFDLILADISAGDPLFRETTLFRTLLHEIGHGLGLVHTIGIDDAMYFGGDYIGYYRRYRESVTERGEMRFRPGLSAMDRERLRTLYPESALYPPKYPKSPKSDKAKSDEPSR